VSCDYSSFLHEAAWLQKLAKADSFHYWRFITMVNKLSHWTVGVLFLSAVGAAQAFPDKSISVVVPFGAGTSVDVHARDFASALGNIVKQPVVIDNRPGAEGTIGALAVINAQPDGHTLLFTSSSIPVLDPVMKKNQQFDPVKDFTPVCTVGRTSTVMNITGSSSIKTASDLIAIAKAQPGKITFAYSSATTRLAGELFQQAAGVKFTGVPYKTSVAGLTDVGGGQVDLFFIDDVSAAPLYQSGRLRPLAVSGASPSATEIGVPGYLIQPWFGVYASVKTPPVAVAQLREVMMQAMKSSVATANIEKRGLSPLLICGDAMTKFQMDEISLWREITKKAGIEPE
jgi:tripartite-type tricarboxylate transporter receptor subunit TctC